MHLVLCSFRRPVLAALLALVASPVLAQTPDEASTRAGLMEQAREALAGQSAPPERSAVERGLSWYDNQYLFAKLLGGWKGFHLAGGDFPAGAGLKLGIGYDKALTPADPIGSQPPRSHRAWSVQHERLRASERRRDTLAISAVRASTSAPPASTTTSRRRTSSAPAWTAWSRTGPTTASRHTKAASPSAGSRRGSSSAAASPISVRASGEAPTVGLRQRTISSPRLPPRALARRRTFLRADVSAELDWRDNPAHPHAGGRYAVALTQFADRDLGRYDFRRVDVALQHYVPLPDRYRLVALRAEGVFTNADSGKEVPFYLQPTLGGATPPPWLPRVAFSRSEQRARRRGVPLGSMVGPRRRSLRRCRHGRAVPPEPLAARDGSRLRHRLPVSQQPRVRRPPGSRSQP